MSRKKVSGRATKTEGVRGYGRYLIFGGIGVGVIALFALLVFSLRGPEGMAGLQLFPRQDRSHDEAATYTGDLPPSGGAHSSEWQTCGIYDEPIEAKHAVHSLEHGAVWLAYQPDLPQETVLELRDLVRGQPYVLMSPYPGLPAPVVMTAWGVQLVVDKLPDERIAAFVVRYQSGPQTPELGATCSDGVGQPIS